MAPKQNQETLQENSQPNPGELPLVLVHCKRAVNLSSRDRDALLAQFNILNPSESPEPIQSFLSIHAQSVRALLCIGPTPISREILALLPSLELIVCSTSGLDHVDLLECHRRSITIPNASAAFSDDVADYAIALLIDVLRRISAGDRYIRSRLWPPVNFFIFTCWLLFIIFPSISPLK